MISVCANDRGFWFAFSIAQCAREGCQTCPEVLQQGIGISHGGVDG